ALRATRVEPIAAVREGVLPPSRLARFGPLAAVVTLAVSLALLLIGGFVKSIGTTDRLLAIGIGVLASFVGMALLAPRVVPVLARTLGWPGMRMGGIAGRSSPGRRCRSRAGG